jgi:hypothetical protein
MIPVGWGPREPPLPIAGVAGVGHTARALGRALGARPDDRLRAVAGDGVLVLLGPAESLPWVDDADWLGIDPAAPGLWLPTAWTPDRPLPLVADAIRQAAGSCAVLVRHGLAVPVDAARPVDAATLAAWLAR